MLTKKRIREIALQKGADLFGIASVNRFSNAPKGFHPRDVYSKTESIIAYAIKVPSESLFAENPIPFTQTNFLAMQKMDQISYEISLELDKLGVKNVLIPTDDPLLYWETRKPGGYYRYVIPGISQDLENLAGIICLSTRNMAV